MRATFRLGVNLAALFVFGCLPIVLYGLLFERPNVAHCAMAHAQACQRASDVRFLEDSLPEEAL